MSGAKVDRRAARTYAASQDDELISRAARRTGWASSALEGAAGDLADVGSDVGEEDNAYSLTGLAELLHDEAQRVSHLAEDIASQRGDPDD